MIAIGVIDKSAVIDQAVAQGVPDPRRSGYRDMGPALQKMQDDDTANPGMLFVQKGAGLWRTPAGASGKACADCHKDYRASRQ